MLTKFSIFKKKTKYWLPPVLVGLIIFILVLIFGEGSSIAPFLYTILGQQ
jgi:hypothetical protein